MKPILALLLVLGFLVGMVFLVISTTQYMHVRNAPPPAPEQFLTAEGQPAAALSMYGKATDGPGADPSYTPPPGAAARYEAYLRAHRPGPPPDPGLFVEPDPSSDIRELRNPEARANQRHLAGSRPQWSRGTKQARPE